MDKNKILLDDIMNPDIMKTITICGSAKFRKLKEKYQAYYTLKGNIVHMPVNFSIIQDEMDPTKDSFEYNHFILDKIHREKIMQSDAVLIVNYYNYIGHDTGEEMIFAYKNGKPLLFSSIEDLDGFNFNNDDKYPLYIIEESEMNK